MSNYYFNHDQHFLGCGHKASTAPLNVIFKLCHDYAQLRSISRITAHMPLAPLPSPPAPIIYALSFMLSCTHSGSEIQLVNYVPKLSLTFHFYCMCFGMPGSSQYPCLGFWGKNLELSFQWIWILHHHERFFFGPGGGGGCLLGYWLY